MRSKTDQIRAAWASSDRIAALRIAAQFFDRSTATKTFQRGMNANNHPDFYRQLGKVIGSTGAILPRKVFMDFIEPYRSRVGEEVMSDFAAYLIMSSRRWVCVLSASVPGHSRDRIRSSLILLHVPYVGGWCNGPGRGGAKYRSAPARCFTLIRDHSHDGP
jgi:hypothetical protein